MLLLEYDFIIIFFIVYDSFQCSVLAKEAKRCQ